MINIAIVMQHVRGMPSRPLVAITGTEHETALDKGNRWAMMLKAGCTQISGAERMLCRTGQEDDGWEDVLEVVVLDIE